ncbi:hypothetical protein T06_8196, partial [Trichinella sp. T6]
LIPTFQGNFPNTRVQGWFFHFCQGVFRHVGRLSLRTNFMNNQEAFLHKVALSRPVLTSSVVCLRLPPLRVRYRFKKGKNADGISAGFEIINVGTSGQLEALFQYFQREWLPAATIPLWNVYGVSVRTNNHLE